MNKGQRPILPTFLIPGAAKAGSSTLYHYLGQHPDIIMSSEKEPDVFTGRWQHEGIAYYERCYTHYAGEKAIGEATVEYMRDPKAPARIYSVIPNVKLIFTLRNPIDRAVSHYWWRVYNGEEHRSFDEVIREGKEEYPIDYGRYYTHISRFLKYFPLENMHFVILEWMAKEVQNTFHEIFEFLEVDPEFVVQYTGPKNRAVTRKSRLLEQFLNQLKHSQCLRRLIPTTVEPLARRFMSALRHANTKPFVKPEPRQDQIDYLKEVFKPEIKGLESILGYKIDEWG